MDNGRFQKTSIPYHSHLFGIPRAKGGGGEVHWTGNLKEWGYLLYDWNSEGMGGRGLYLEFPQGTDKQLYLENAYFMDFRISSQIKHELATLLTTAEEGNKTSIHQSLMLSCLFVEVNQQNVGCTTMSRSHNATKHLFFSRENSLINCFVH